MAKIIPKIIDATATFDASLLMTGVGDGSNERMAASYRPA